MRSLESSSGYQRRQGPEHENQKGAEQRVMSGPPKPIGKSTASTGSQALKQANFAQTNWPQFVPLDVWQQWSRLCGHIQARPAWMSTTDIEVDPKTLAMLDALPV